MEYSFLLLCCQSDAYEKHPALRIFFRECILFDTVFGAYIARVLARLTTVSSFTAYMLSQIK